MIRRAPRPRSDFLMVNNAVVRDQRLSLKATGLLVRILSRPDDWRTDRDSLARDCKEGVTAVRSALQELRTAGYLVQTKRQDDRGHWVTETVLYDHPQASSQVTPEAGDRPPDHRPPGFQPLYEVLDEVSVEEHQPSVGAELALSPSPHNTITQRSKRITDAYAQAQPMCRWPAINGIVIKAIKTEQFTDEEIRAALLRLANEGRTVSVETLRIELQGMPPRQAPAANGNRDMLARAMERALAKEASGQ